MLAAGAAFTLELCSTYCMFMLTTTLGPDNAATPIYTWQLQFSESLVFTSTLYYVRVNNVWKMDRDGRLGSTDDTPKPIIATLKYVSETTTQSRVPLSPS